MAGDEHPATDGAGQRRWQDRDTEPIPRARPSATGDPSDASHVDEDDDYSEPYVAASSRPASDEYYDEPPTISPDEFAGLSGSGGERVYRTSRVAPLEEEASRHVIRYLFPTEKFRGEWKRHWIQLVREFSIGAVATLLMGYITGWLTKHNQAGFVTAVLVIWAFVMGWVAWKVVDWWYDRFILTNKRVMVVSGIFSRKVAMMPLLRVTDMKYVQTFLGRLLRYGNFELESAGQDQALRNIKNLPNPNELYLRIVEEMYEPEAVEARLGRASDDSADGT